MNGLTKTMRRPALLALSVLLTLSSAFPALAANRQPNDPHFGEQWYLPFIGAPEAWNRSLGFEGITVAIIDSGVDIDHPDLRDNIWLNLDERPGDGLDNDLNGYVDDFYGWDFVDGDNDPNPVIGEGYSSLGVNHGTISAGIVAARGDNGLGISGVTWQTRLMAIRALDSNGSGDPNRVADAVEYAVRNGAKVINLSFVGQTYNQRFADVLRRAHAAGVFVVAAAGNAPDGGEAIDLDREPLYPVCFDRDSSENFVYGVTAVDQNDRRASFANYGAGCVDISAPGTRIVSTQVHEPRQAGFDQPYGGYFNGTSVAASVVSGSVALIWALDRNLTPRQIQNILLESSFPIDDLNPGLFGKLGRGRIDAARAVHRTALGRRSDTEPIPVTTASLLPPGTGNRLVAAAAGPGRAPEIRLFTDAGLFIRGFSAFPDSFRGGISLAVGNFDGNARSSLVAGALSGGAPHVRIFNVNTVNIGGFYAYDNAFRGGVQVATGDIDGDGRDEIVTGAGPGGGPHVRVFTSQGVSKGNFFVTDSGYRGGIDVACADLDGDGRAEIVVSHGSGSAARLGVFDGQGTELAEFAPVGLSGRGSLSVSAVDLNGDGRAEIVALREGGNGSRYAYAGDGTPLGSFGEGDPIAGLALASVGLPGNTVEIPTRTVWGSPVQTTPQVTIRSQAGPFGFVPFEPGFRGGVEAAFVEAGQ